jgi:hypothetical protein
MFDACMCMWGKSFPKIDTPDWPCTPVGREVCDFLVGEENIVLYVVQYLYTGMYWRGYPNILFTTIEPFDERDNIIVML